ncbi:tyrosine phenol-lyase, partial [mine drainage metagenome]
EATELDYLAHRIAQIRFLGERLTALGVPIFRPVGGHAVYLDVHRFLPHLPDAELPGQALVVEIYREGGVRTVEVGSLMFEKSEDGGGKTLELVRLAVPRRVYSAAQLAFVADVVGRVYARRATIRGLRFTHRPAHLPHFTARFAPLEERPTPGA